MSNITQSPYWVQQKAPNGGWIDRFGCHLPGKARRIYADAVESGGIWRLVERNETVLETNDPDAVATHEGRETAVPVLTRHQIALVRVALLQRMDKIKDRGDCADSYKAMRDMLDTGPLALQNLKFTVS